MEYRHAPRESYEDLASGHVLHSAPGQPAFPVRLGLELLHRAIAHLPARQAPVTLWDPCCGSAQLVTALGLRARTALGQVVASDIDPSVLPLAERNLRLLTTTGLDERGRELRALADRHGRSSHHQAARAAARLRDQLVRDGGDLPARLAQVDALDAGAVGEVADAVSPDVVLADVPYGQLTGWTANTAATDDTPDTANTAATDDTPDTGDTGDTATDDTPDTADAADAGDAAFGRLLTTLGAALPPGCVVVAVARARRIALPPGSEARERLKVGHRAAVIVRAGDLGGP